ncbi:MAG TPA: carboxypeptidase-like regulatory domain-containing protein [Blastocatellia bacterium]|nr:carboxypeptidase-like regulatory domain-containing protein [Blastocatellia bacterium]
MNRDLTAWCRSIMVLILLTQLSPSLAAQSRVRERASGSAAGSGGEFEGTITGRVVFDGGDPAVGALVLARAVGSTVWESDRLGIAECDQEGKFELTRLKPGAYLLSASRPGGVDLAAGSDPQIYRVGETATIRMAGGGVISGLVTDAAGEPLEGMRVTIYPKSGSTTSSLLIPESEEYTALTDDRGLYRIYGIRPGTYLARAADTPVQHFSFGRFRNDSPAYYSPGDRRAAAEITVRSGEELKGIDIRHRGERGRNVSGIVSGRLESETIFNMVSVTLRDEASGELGGATLMLGAGRFDIYGVPDGVYEVVARYFSERSGLTSSAPRRIAVKGAHLTGVDLALAKPGSISGRVIVESSRPGAGCGRPGRRSVEEIALRVKKVDGGESREESRLAEVNAQGEFALGLQDGLYRIVPDLPGDDWYLKALTLAGRSAETARGGLSIKPGEMVTGLEVKVAEGAATLRGRMAAANESSGIAGASVPPRWRAHLVPAEDAAADDLVCYAETIVRGDGSFELKHLAPGRYLLLVRELSGKEADSPSRPTAWDPLERERLRRDAQSRKQEIELGPCQQATFTWR